MMQIAIASGKGGTGKTTVATNLAFVASRNGQAVAYLDCDVEEPNGHIFLKPELTNSRAVGVPVPQVDTEACTNCGLCGKICQYSAIVCIGQKVLVYPELCHSCGGCELVCPVGAITETPREVGLLEMGLSGRIQFVHGLLNIGEAMSPPLIREVRSSANEADLVIIDAPPGTSCPVVESVSGCDYVVLVTEPTPFGLHDLKLAVDMLRALGLPFGLVINRCDVGDDKVRSYCEDGGIEILSEIPDDRRVAEAYSRGVLACEALPEYREQFEKILKRINGVSGE